MFNLKKIKSEIESKIQEKKLETEKAIKDKSRMTEALEEAWEYFKMKNNLPKYLEVGTIPRSAKGEVNKEQADKWHAFRHAYTSAKFTDIHGTQKAKFFGDLNEINGFGNSTNLGNHPLDRNMDLNNNAIGRGIRTDNHDMNKLLNDVYYVVENDKRVVLDQNADNNKPFADSFVKNQLWSWADNRYYQHEAEQNSKKNMQEGVKKYMEPNSTIQKIIKVPLGENGNKKTYTGMAADIPVTTDRDMLEGVRLSDKVMYDKEPYPIEFRDYLLTQEQKDEYKALYEREMPKVQNRTLPTREELDEQVRSGGLIYVDDYTRSDGIKVSGYFRRRG